MTIFAHSVRLLALALCFAACSEAPSSQVEPVSTDESFGVREIDPWADEPTDPPASEPAPENRSATRPVGAPMSLSPQQSAAKRRLSRVAASRHLRPSPLTPSMTSEIHRARTPSRNRSPNPSRSQRPKTRRSQAFKAATVSTTSRAYCTSKSSRTTTRSGRFKHNHAIRSTNWTGELRATAPEPTAG